MSHFETKFDVNRGSHDGINPVEKPPEDKDKPAYKGNWQGTQMYRMQDDPRKAEKE